MREGSYEPNNNPERQEEVLGGTKPGKYEEATDAVLDVVVFNKVQEEIRKKFEADPNNIYTPEEEMPYHLLGGLKGNIIDPLYRGAWLKNDKELGKYSHETELRSTLKAEMLAHYKEFLFPGLVRYDEATGETVLEEPHGLNYEIQKMILRKAGFTLDNSNLVLFEQGKEDEIPKESLKKGLIVSISDGERDRYEKKISLEKESRAMNAGPTLVLHESLDKAGFFRELEGSEKKQLLGAALFADIIERGEWLSHTKEDFFDKTKINLFKINRLLDAEQCSEILGDMLRSVRVDWSNLPSAKEVIRQAIIRESEIPLSQEFVSKHHLEKAVLKQKESMETSYAYLRSGKNVKRSRMGNIVYIQRDKLKYGDRLPGNLPAIAAQPPDVKGKPAWGERHGYFETSKNSFLGYVREKRAARFLEGIRQVGKERSLNPQIHRIDGWVKIFVPFQGSIPEGFLTWLEIEGLALQDNNREQKRKAG